MPFAHAFLPAPPASKARPVRDVPLCISANAPSLPPVPPRRPSSTPSRRPRQTPPRTRPHVHARNIQRTAAAGDIPAMQAAVRAAVADGFTLSAVNYTIIANAHAEHGDPAHVFGVLSLMRSRNIHPTNVTLRVAIKACDAWNVSHAAVAALTTALTWAAQNMREEAEAKTWNLALRALARKGATSQMVTVLRWMRTGVTDYLPGIDHPGRENIPQPTPCAYNTCLHALGRKDNFAEAIRLFADILVRRQPGAPPVVDVVTYNTLLEMAINSKRYVFPDVLEPAVIYGAKTCNPIQFVKAITKSMQRNDVQTNITTETLILRLLTRKHAIPPDRRYIRFRMQTVLSNAQTQTQYDADKKYFDALITAFAHATDMNGVADAFETMISRGIVLDFRTVRAVLLAASHCGDIQLAIRIIDVAFDNGLSCDDHMYTTAISACARSEPRDPYTADLLLNQALERGTPWTSAMVNAAIASYEGNVSKAVDLWKSLRTASQASGATVLGECTVYEALMRVCGRGSRPDFALRIFYAAKNAGHVSANTSESRRIFSSFMRGLREADATVDMKKNPLKWQYMRHLRTECGGYDEMQLPIERIRIKF